MCDLRLSNFTATDLRGGKLRGADLRGAYFIKAVAPGVDFTGANLTDALMDRAVFVGADFTDAVLARTVLTLSDMKDANVTNADFTDALCVPPAVPLLLLSAAACLRLALALTHRRCASCAPQAGQAAAGGAVQNGVGHQPHHRRQHAQEPGLRRPPARLAVRLHDGRQLRQAGGAVPC